MAIAVNMEHESGKKKDCHNNSKVPMEATIHQGRQEERLPKDLARESQLQFLAYGNNSNTFLGA